jgi:hypothetical protein
MAAVIDEAPRASFKPFIWPDIAPEQQALECLEAEITELGGHINAATYRFLALVAEFDRREGWALHGLANCAQWLNWQCGIGAVAAREKVRVARALEGLPEISAAFRQGTLSYSKVRALTRIATPANEQDLRSIAEHGTAAHVDRLVGKYRRVERLEEAARANAAHRSRSLYWFYDEDGSFVMHAKLPAEVGAIVKQAIEAALAVLDDDARCDAPKLAEVAPPEVGPEAVQTESNVSAEAIASAVSPEASEATHQRQDLADRLGRQRADALRRLAETFLARQSEAGGAVADRFQVVVHVDQRLLASPATARSPAAGQSPAAGRSPTENDLPTEPCNDAPLEALATARCELDDGRALALETVRRLACDASLVGIVEDEDGEPLNVGRKTRSIPPALQRALKARDGGCRFPGCGRRGNTEGHHVKHWAEGGETKLGNLITLCRFHHRLIHEGGFGLQIVDAGAAQNRFVFTRPDGTRVEAAGTQRFRGSDAAPPGPPALFALNRAAGVAIDWQTARCRWLGERMDYGLAVQALVQRRDLAAGLR